MARVDYELISRLYEQGMSDRQITETAGAARSTVAYWRYRNSLKPNPGLPEKKKPRYEITEQEKQRLVHFLGWLTWAHGKAENEGLSLDVSQFINIYRKINCWSE